MTELKRYAVFGRTTTAIWRLFHQDSCRELATARVYKRRHWSIPGASDFQINLEVQVEASTSSNNRVKVKVVNNKVNLLVSKNSLVSIDQISFCQMST